MHTAELKPLMDKLVPIKDIGAHLTESYYEVSVQDIHWVESGAVHLFSRQHCLLELAEPPSPALPGRTRYQVLTPDGKARTAGALNIMPPETGLKIHWNAGRRHSIVCIMELERVGLMSGIDWQWDQIDPASLLDIHNDRLRVGMQWLAEETTSPSFASTLQTSCLLSLLAQELHRHTTRGQLKEATPRDRLSSKQLARIKELVEDSYDPDGPSLASLAEACRLPARELSTLFKQTTGETLRAYVAASHIARAKRLLADEDLLIKQVAYRSGFRSAAAFGDAFRRATGMTPLQYRQHQASS
jgi:AraC family transcriptional regulator